MTLQELIDWAKANKIDFNTSIALRDKDDYLLVTRNIQMDIPYFGNCTNGGDDFIRQIAPRDADGDVDYGKLPKFLILSTGY